LDTVTTFLRFEWSNYSHIGRTFGTDNLAGRGGTRGGMIRGDFQALPEQGQGDGRIFGNINGLTGKGTNVGADGRGRQVT
jgi:hypothetical protein